VATASSGEDVLRLAAVIARQQRELVRMRSQAAARSVVDLAKGTLMERLGCSSAEAARQLMHLAAEAGIPLAELAAAVINAAAVTSHDPVQGAEEELRQPRLAEAAIGIAADGAGLAAAVLDQALAPVGAVAVALWLIEPDGCLELLGGAGLGALEASRWRRIPPEMDSLAQRVAHDGRDLWWAAGRRDGDSTPLLGRWPGGARAVLPLRDTGVMLGVMEICWPTPLAEVPDGLHRQLTALAGMCAQTLGIRLGHGDLSRDGQTSWLYGLLDGVLESVLFAHAIRDEDGRVTDFSIDHVSEGFRDPAGRDARELAGRTLLGAYPTTALTDGLFERAVHVLETGEPQHTADAVTSALVDDVAVTPVMDVRIARLFDGVVIAWWRADETDRLAALLQHAQRLGRIGGWEENLMTGEVIWTDSAFALFGLSGVQGAAIPTAELHNYVSAEDAHGLKHFREALLRDLKAAGATFRIVRPDGNIRQMRVFGEPVVDSARTVVALRGAFQDVSAQYHTQVALAATRDQLADSEQRADDEHRLALRLQRAIMPPTAQPVEAAGIDLAVRYRPAGAAHLVGGDWYDTVLLPTKEVLLVVGDIAGHGIDAVTGMIAMRNCLRGLAITGAGPAALLDMLNSVACHLTDGTIGTVVCGLYNPASRILRWARAGHLPPVVVRDGSAAALPLPHGILLGTDPDSSYQEVTTSLRLGDAVLLFTDGLIERRDIPIDEALDSLLSAASRPVTSVARYADYLISRSASDTGDDACLVAVHVQ